MKRIALWVLLAFFLVLALRPLAGQTVDTTVHCRACVLIDSTAHTDSLPVTSWQFFTRWTYAYRDSLILTAKPFPPVAAVQFHEPAGFRVVADAEWAGVSPATPAVGKALGPWVRFAAGNYGWAVLDSTAPGSPWALEVRTPAGAKQGSGYEHLNVSLPAGTTKLYLRWAVFVPVGYVAPAGNQVQKLFHVWGTYDGGTTGSLAVPSLYGTGLAAQIRFQNMRVTATQAISFNRSCGQAPRGRWVPMEALLDIRAGSATLWVDGRQCGPWPVTYTAKAGASWQTVSLNPTYGGTGSVPAGAAIRFSRVRVSVAP